MTRNDSGGRVTTPTAAMKISRHQAADAVQAIAAIAAHRLPVATAVAVPPIGRRLMWLLWVASCPACSYGHAHRAAGPVGGVRIATCGATYFVKVVRAQGRAAS